MNESMCVLIMCLHVLCICLCVCEMHVKWPVDGGVDQNDSMTMTLN